MIDRKPVGLYERWREERWETPVSDAGSLRLVSLLDDGALHLTLEDGHDAERRRWRFTFERTAGYVNMLEEYRLSLWKQLKHTERTGWTVRIPDSPWIAHLVKIEAFIPLHHPHLKHFQVKTEDDVVDVLTSIEPRIEEIEPAAPGSPPAGKSIVMHQSREPEAMKQVLNNLVDELRALQRDLPPSSS